MTVYVTPAQRDLARLDLELAERLGEPADPHMVAIAHAEPADPEPRRATVDEIAEAFEQALAQTRMWRFKTDVDAAFVELAQGPRSDFWLHINGLRMTDHLKTRQFVSSLAHQLADLAPMEQAGEAAEAEVAVSPWPEPDDALPPGSNTLKRKWERLRTGEAPATSDAPPRETEDFR